MPKAAGLPQISRQAVLCGEAKTLDAAALLLTMARTIGDKIHPATGAESSNPGAVATYDRCRQIWCNWPTSCAQLLIEAQSPPALQSSLDIDSLLRHFGVQPEFWDRLVPRAVDLGLTRPLYYALRYSMKLLGTPVPESIADAAELGRPSTIVRALMDFCYSRALRANHSTCSDGWTPVARRLLYVRSHWLRMPFLLLVVHLARKAFMFDRPPESEAGALNKQQEQNPH